MLHFNEWGVGSKEFIQILRIGAAHFGAFRWVETVPRALPWADMGLALWAVFGDRKVHVEIPYSPITIT